METRLADLYLQKTDSPLFLWCYAAFTWNHTDGGGGGLDVILADERR